MTIFASTFISHSSMDKEFARQLATALGRRGIMAWLDESDLSLGADLGEELRKSIIKTSTLTAIISEKSIKSDWVSDELDAALTKYEENGLDDKIIPIYRSAPLPLIKESSILSNRWLTPDRMRVKKLGVQTESLSNINEISDKIAEAVYKCLNFNATREIMLFIDQRASTRRGFPEGMTHNIKNHPGAVGCVFRPNQFQGKERETLIGDDWESLCLDMRSGLSRAFGSLRWSSQKKIYISGHGQLGFAYFMGDYFNRSTDAILYCSDTRNGNSFDNSGWPRENMLTEGDPECTSTSDPRLAPIPDTPFEAMALIVGRISTLDDALPYLEAHHPGTPIAFVKTPAPLEDSSSLRKLTADCTALMQNVKRHNKCRHVYIIFGGLPFAAVPLFVAHMRYVMPQVTFLEFRSDLLGQAVDVGDTYAALPMVSA